ADTQVTAEQARPEAEVLLMQRGVEPEDLAVIVRHAFQGLGVADRGTGKHAPDGVARHETRDHPVDGDRDDEGQDVDETLTSDVTPHMCLQVMAAGGAGGVLRWGRDADRGVWGGSAPRPTRPVLVSGRVREPRPVEGRAVPVGGGGW